MKGRREDSKKKRFRAEVVHRVAVRKRKRMRTEKESALTWVASSV